MDHARRIAAVRRALAERDADALVAPGIPNAQYLSGFRSQPEPSQWSTYPLVVVTRDEARLFVSRLDRDTARERADIDWEVPSEGFVDAVEAMVDGSAVVPGSATLGLAERLDIRVEVDDDLLADLRAVKDDREVGRLREALRITEDVVADEVPPLLREGAEEKAVADHLAHAMRTRGADGEAFPTLVESGERSASPHGEPREVAVDGPVLVDIGAVVDGYRADYSRTFHVGQPSERFIEVYETVQAAQAAAERALRAGAPAREVDAAAREVIEDAGHGDAFLHSTGHGVGLDIHERPNLSPRADEDTTLEAGNVVTLEPGIYLDGAFGVRIEDVYRVEEGGAERLTATDRSLRVVER